MAARRCGLVVIPCCYRDSWQRVSHITARDDACSLRCVSVVTKIGEMQTVLRTGRRDALIVGLTEQLLAAREQNARLLEQNAWLRAALPDSAAPLHLVPGAAGRFGQAPRRSSSPAVARMP